MDDCIFCKIGKGEIPSVKIYENENFLAFMDISPVAKGHTLLIPKAHSKWMNETDDSTIEKIFVLAKTIMNKIKAGLSCDYVQLSIVGEEVPHFHIHLIPRSFNDGLAKWATQTYNSQEEMESYAKKISN